MMPFQFKDAEVYRELTTPVQSALDEAAAKLSRIKAEQAQTGHQQHPQQHQQQKPSQNGPAGPHGAVGTSSAQGNPSHPTSPLQRTSPSSPQTSHSQTSCVSKSKRNARIRSRPESVKQRNESKALKLRKRKKIKNNHSSQPSGCSLSSCLMLSLMLVPFVSHSFTSCYSHVLSDRSKNDSRQWAKS